uniref:Taste receptor type 2 n=1 Tax=Leptobrachium leishanense TaxID=445787 RepID=A0A8C5PAB6_9ANUR
MGTHIETFTLIFQLVFDLLGLVSNVKVRRISPKEKLFISLGIANLCLQITMAANDTFYKFWHRDYKVAYVGKSFFLIGLVTVSSCLWISTWYCIYCCVKITNSHQKVVMWLQQKIPKMVTWLIIGSVLMATAQTLPAINDLDPMYQNIFNNGQQNATAIMVGFRSKCSCTLQMYIGISVVAFVLFFIGTVCILHSLWSHVRNMEKSGFPFGNPRFHKLSKAAVTVTSLLILCITFCTAQILLFSGLVVYETPPFLICMTLISMYTSLNATVLIMGNQKLKQSVTDLFKKFIEKCCWRKSNAV